MDKAVSYAVVALIIGLVIGAGVIYAMGPTLFPGPEDVVSRKDFDTLKSDYDILKIDNDKTKADLAAVQKELDELKNPPVVPKPKIKVAAAVTARSFLDYNRGKTWQYLEDWGYDVELDFLEVRSAIAAIVSGEKDFLTTNAIEYLPAIEGGAELIQSTILGTRGYQLVVSKDVTSIADLKGKVIGASSWTAISYIYLKYALIDAGIDPDTEVTWEMVGGSRARYAALLGGSINAGIIYTELTWQLLEETDTVHSLGALGQFVAGGETRSGICVVQSFKDEHPEAVKDVVKASIKANVFTLSQKDAYIDEGKEWTEEEVPEPLSREWYERLYDEYILLYVWGLEFTRLAQERAMTYCIETESITGPIPVDTWNDFDLYNEAFAEMYE
jgi:ABC-type nitrate/sulfonate/bicarbonate transport system substrate-binding protein